MRILKQVSEFLTISPSKKKVTEGEPKEQISEIKLESGGKVKLSIDVDLFGLSKADSDFVLKLVEEVKGYKKQRNK